MGNKLDRKIKGHGMDDANKEGAIVAKKVAGRVKNGARQSLTAALTNIDKPKSGGALNVNWQLMKKTISRNTKFPKTLSNKKIAEEALPEVKTPDILAVDCEMVGLGPCGSRSSLARVAVVNDQGEVLLDKFVRQTQRVTDYRTRFSGVRWRDLNSGSALSFEEVQKAVADLIKGKIIVGHDIKNDLLALLLEHPDHLIRDTAKYPPLMRAPGPGRKASPRSLKELACNLLGLIIQTGEHCPAEDARTSLYLYQRNAKDWERQLALGTISQLSPTYERKGGDEASLLAALAAKDSMVDL